MMIYWICNFSFSLGVCRGYLKNQRCKKYSLRDQTCRHPNFYLRCRIYWWWVVLLGWLGSVSTRMRLTQWRYMVLPPLGVFHPPLKRLRWTNCENHDGAKRKHGLALQIAKLKDRKTEWQKDGKANRQGLGGGSIIEIFWSIEFNDPLILISCWFKKTVWKPVLYSS